MPAAGRPDAPTPSARTGMASVRTRIVAFAVVAALGAIAVAGIVAVSRGGAPASSSAASGTTAGAELGELRVSRDFGATTLLERRVSITATTTAMELLADNATVETAYSGGFVNAIDGLASSFDGGLRADWFYYVNGIQADRGAADYKLSGRDREWWDHHRWDFAVSVPAVVGQFPQPFLSGADTLLPTVVMYAEGSLAPAKTVAAALEDAGVRRVSEAPLEANAALPDERHVILVGTWDELASVPDLAEALERPGTSGLFARFEDGGLVTLDSLGAETARGAPAGVVLATARTSGSDAALWVVSGAGDADVKRAAALLEGGAPDLLGRFGVAVMRDGSAFGLPTEPAQ